MPNLKMTRKGRGLLGVIMATGCVLTFTAYSENINRKNQDIVPSVPPAPSMEQQTDVLVTEGTLSLGQKRTPARPKIPDSGAQKPAEPEQGDKSFVPSESISADNDVPFPVDI